MDQGTEQKVIEALRNLYRQNHAYSYTQKSILAMVDRVFVMDNGNIITDQSPEQLGIKKVVSNER